MISRSVLQYQVRHLRSSICIKMWALAVLALYCLPIASTMSHRDLPLHVMLDGLILELPNYVVG